jgi:hypothetical protein
MITMKTHTTRRIGIVALIGVVAAGAGVLHGRIQHVHEIASAPCVGLGCIKVAPSTAAAVIQPKHPMRSLADYQAMWHLERKPTTH